MLMPYRRLSLRTVFAVTVFSDNPGLSLRLSYFPIDLTGLDSIQRRISPILSISFFRAAGHAVNLLCLFSPLTFRPPMDPSSPVPNGRTLTELN